MTDHQTDMGGGVPASADSVHDRRPPSPFTCSVEDGAPYPSAEVWEVVGRPPGMMTTVKHRPSGRVFTVPMFEWRGYRNNLPRCRAMFRDLLAGEGGKRGFIINGEWLER